MAYEIIATNFEPDGSWRPGPETMVLSPSQQAALLFMACLQCGVTMRRGTQCGNCGAWCR